MTTKTRTTRILPRGVSFASIPGPTRKRESTPYCYRVTYENPHRFAAGCLVLWDVMGGREVYQVALEREENGRLRWHCTCADAVYRGERRAEPCKHVRGLQTSGRQSA
ncbi:MAG: hypothetical protein U0797_13440 [Gemmataceae bacterium]